MDKRQAQTDAALYSQLLHLPFTLWEAVHYRLNAAARKSSLGSIRSRHIFDDLSSLEGDARRFSFQFINREVSIDVGLIARMYRGWWARFFFTQEAGVGLRDFVTTENKRWPRKTKKRVATAVPLNSRVHSPSTGPLSRHERETEVLLSSYLEAVKTNRRDAQRLSFRRLSNAIDPVVGRRSQPAMFFLENITRVDERQIDRLLKSGDTPVDVVNLLNIMVLAYIERPTEFPGLPMTLDDVYLPDFRATDVEDGKYDVSHRHDGGIMYRPNPRAKKRTKVD